MNVATPTNHGDQYLGIDVGTSSVKVILIDQQGSILRSTSEPYPLMQPQTGWTEQHALTWWHATVKAIRSLNAGNVAAIGLSGQMHGLVLLSEQSRLPSEGGTEADMAPLRPVILWNDQRTAAQCAHIEQAFGGRVACVRMVGNAPLTGFTLPKLLWVREHEPEIWARTLTFILPKDYLRWVMTGVIATDVGDASGTLLLDPATRMWSGRACECAEIPSTMLPRVMESGDIGGTLTDWAASQLGLQAGIPVVAGSGDNMMGAVGAGIVYPGAAVITIGTSGVVYAHADRPLLDIPASGEAAAAGRFHTMCGPDGDGHHKGTWCVTGCMLSAGGSLAWAREQLWPNVPYDVLLAEAATVPPGCDGLSFLPYLTGERCPYADPTARGGWIGLTARHTRGHLVRAVLEGVACALAEIVDLQRSRGVELNRIFVGGGGMKTPLWRQMVCDMVGSPLLIPNTEEGPAFGGAILAMRSRGSESLAGILGGLIREQGRMEPQGHLAVYAGVRTRQRDLYQRLKDPFAEMAEKA